MFWYSKPSSLWRPNPGLEAQGGTGKRKKHEVLVPRPSIWLRQGVWFRAYRASGLGFSGLGFRGSGFRVSRACGFQPLGVFEEDCRTPARRMLKVAYSTTMVLRFDDINPALSQGP